MKKHITHIISKGMLLRINEVMIDDKKDGEEVVISLIRKKSLVSIKYTDKEFKIITTAGEVASFYAPSTKAPKAVVVFSQDGKEDKNYGKNDLESLIADLSNIFSNPNQATTKTKA